jgi:hypothetical protein
MVGTDPVSAPKLCDPLPGYDQPHQARILSGWPLGKPYARSCPVLDAIGSSSLTTLSSVEGTSFTPINEHTGNMPDDPEPQLTRIQLSY